MSTLRYDLFAYADALGGVVLQPLQNLKLSARAATLSEARAELQAGLEWTHRHEGTDGHSSYRDVTLTRLSVEVRPEHGTPEDRRPAGYALNYPVECVTASGPNNQKFAFIPRLLMKFAYSEKDDIAALVRRYAVQALEQAAPLDLVAMLPRSAGFLDTLAVSAKRPNEVEVRQPAPEALTGVAEDLGSRTSRRRLGHPWERDNEVAQVRALMSQEGVSGVLIVGETGCGKSTVLAHAASLIDQQKKTEAKARREAEPSPAVWQTSAGRIVAGMKYLGQWEERVEAMIAALGEVNGWLAVEDLLELVRVGGQGPNDSLAAYVMPFVRRGELRLVAEATPAGVSACRRLLPGLVESFRVVQVEPMDDEKSLAVVRKLLDLAATNEKVESGAMVGPRLIHLFRRFMPGEAFPGAAVPFLRRVVRRARREGHTELSQEFLDAAFRRQTGLPEAFLDDSLAMERADVLGRFRRRIIGQEAACGAAADCVVRFKAAMTDPDRPVAVLLLCGPTGVGKTETAKALAEEFFGAGEDGNKPDSRLVRLDMSEFATWDALDRLFGSETTPSDLVRRVRRQPFSVVLFDEIEKAAPEVFDAMLGLFDEGRLTDRFGRTTSFRSCLILLSSNLGADAGGGFGYGSDAVRPEAAYLDAAKKFFRPEFVNRLDAVVPYKGLGRDSVERITRKELAAMSAREGLSGRGVSVEFTDELVAELARTGFDARYGARPLQRAIERAVTPALAAFLLGNPELRGGSVRLDWREGQVMVGVG